MPSAEMTSIRGGGWIVVSRTNEFAGDDADVDPKLGGFTMIRACRASWLTDPRWQPCVDILRTATIIIALLASGTPSRRRRASDPWPRVHQRPEHRRRALQPGAVAARVDHCLRYELGRVLHYRLNHIRVILCQIAHHVHHHLELL